MLKELKGKDTVKKAAAIVAGPGTHTNIEDLADSDASDWGGVSLGSEAFESDKDNNILRILSANIVQPRK